MASSTKEIGYGVWKAISTANQSGAVWINDPSAGGMVAIDHGASADTCNVNKAFILEYYQGNERQLKITADGASDIYYATKITPGKAINIIVDVI